MKVSRARSNAIAWPAGRFSSSSQRHAVMGWWRRARAALAEALGKCAFWRRRRRRPGPGQPRRHNHQQQHPDPFAAALEELVALAALAQQAVQQQQQQQQHPQHDLGANVAANMAPAFPAPIFEQRPALPRQYRQRTDA